MQLAIVILNYNDACGTVDAIRRISGFSCIESIIVVDNASTDKSAERIQEAIESANDDRLVFIQSGRNGGYGYGNNIGVRYAHDRLSAKYALIANPDAVFDESLVENMLKIFESDADTAAVGAVMHGQAANITDRNGYIDLTRTRKFTYDEYISSGWKRRSVLQNMLNSGPISRRLFKGYINFPESYYRGEAVADSETEYNERSKTAGRKQISVQKEQTDGRQCSVVGEKNVSADSSRIDAVQVYAVHGSLLMVSTDKFIAAGGYDEAVFLYGEENILAERLLRKCYKTYLMKQGYKHIGSVSIKNAGLQAVKRQQLRNKSENYYYTHYLDCDESGMNIVKLFQRAVLKETQIAAGCGFLR